MGTIKRVNFDTKGIEREEFQDKDIENLFNKKTQQRLSRSRERNAPADMRHLDHQSSKVSKELHHVTL